MAEIDATLDNVIKLNLIPGTRRPRLRCSQYDSGRACTANIFNGDDEYAIDDSAYVTIEGTKPDGNFFSYSVKSDLNGTVSGNVVAFELISNMTVVSGEYQCELCIYDTSSSNTRLASLNFLINVEETPLIGDIDPSTTDIRGILKQLSIAVTAANSASTASEKATSAAVEQIELAKEALTAATGKIVQYELSGTTLYITTTE